MSNAKSTDNQRSVNYLTQVLQKNPLEESAVIIRGRNQLLGLKEKSILPSQSGIDFTEVRKRRERLLQQIEQLRKVVWSAPLDELANKLKKLRANEFPDIQATVERLTTIVANRDLIPALVSSSKFDGEFFSLFKEVLASPPREVAVLKERLLMSFGKFSTRRRGKKMIRFLQAEVPALYELEAGWLNSLTRQKRNSSAAATAASDSPFVTTNFHIPWWAYPLAALAIKMLLKTLTRE